MSGLGSGSGDSCAAQGGVGHGNELFSETTLHLGPLASLQLLGLPGCGLRALGFLSAEICPSAGCWAGAWVCATSQHLKLAGFVAYNS